MFVVVQDITRLGPGKGYSVRRAIQIPARIFMRLGSSVSFTVILLASTVKLGCVVQSDWVRTCLYLLVKATYLSLCTQVKVALLLLLSTILKTSLRCWVRATSFLLCSRYALVRLWPPLHLVISIQVLPQKRRKPILMSYHPAGFSFHQRGVSYSCNQLGLKTQGEESTLQQLNEIISIEDYRRAYLYRRLLSMLVNIKGEFLSKTLVNKIFCRCCICLYVASTLYFG
jgi:hypothetical protein